MGSGLSQIQINKYNWTPLHAACYFGQLSLVEYLINVERLDPKQANANGWDSLIFAVMGGSGFEVVKHLLYNNKIDINHTDNCGKSALTYAHSISPGS